METDDYFPFGRVEANDIPDVNGTRLIKKGDIVRVIEKTWGLPKDLITEVVRIFSRRGPGGGVFLRLKATSGKQHRCSVNNVALASSKGMRFQYKMNGPFIDEI